jgi:hypothetical protein
MAPAKRSNKNDDPKDEADEAPAPPAESPSEEPGPAATTRGAAADEPTGPRPWRVEPFSDGDSWGWRLCAADGTVIHESDTDYPSAERATEAAGGDERTDGSVFPGTGR